MKIRSAIVALTAAALTLAVGACSDSSTSENGAAEVTLWMYPVIRDEAQGLDFWERIEQEFDAAHEDIDLTIEVQSFDQRDAQISAALAAGTGPDIVMITPDQASTYVGVNGLVPLDGAIADERSFFYPAALDVATIDDTLYGIPLFQNANTVAYNTQIFEDAGLDLPQTWEEVLAAAPTLAEDGIAVLHYAGSPETTLNVTFYPLLWQAGGRIFAEDGTDVAFDSPEGIAALQFLLDLQAAGGLPADAATQSNAVEGSALAEGKVAIRYMTNLPELAQMRAALGEENVILGAPLTGAQQVTYSNPGLLSLTSINSEENREAAYEVLRYLVSPEVQADLNEASGTFPTRTDVEAPGGNPDLEAISAALEFANPGEAHPSARQIMAIIAPHIQSALQGSATAEEALAAAANEARELLARS